MSGFGSIWHWILVVVVVLLLFGAGKIPRLMKDLGSGITQFRKGLKDGQEQKDAAAAEAKPGEPAPAQIPAGQPAAAKAEEPKKV
jgi:sec-independent protein translocase protein TatA